MNMCYDDMNPIMNMCSDMNPITVDHLFPTAVQGCSINNIIARTPFSSNTNLITVDHVNMLLCSMNTVHKVLTALLFCATWTGIILKHHPARSHSAIAMVIDPHQVQGCWTDNITHHALLFHKRNLCNMNPTTVDHVRKQVKSKH